MAPSKYICGKKTENFVGSRAQSCFVSKTTECFPNRLQQFPTSSLTSLLLVLFDWSFIGFSGFFIRCLLPFHGFYFAFHWFVVAISFIFSLFFHWSFMCFFYECCIGF